MAQRRTQPATKRSPAKAAPSEPMMPTRAVTALVESATARVQEATVEAMRRELHLLRALVATQNELIASLRLAAEQRAVSGDVDS